MKYKKNLETIDNSYHEKLNVLNNSFVNNNSNENTINTLNNVIKEKDENITDLNKKLIITRNNYNELQNN
jgi:hypothetical protein